MNEARPQAKLFNVKPYEGGGCMPLQELVDYVENTTHPETLLTE
jgi:hypothetical protein